MSREIGSRVWFWLMLIALSTLIMAATARRIAMHRAMMHEVVREAIRDALSDDTIGVGERGSE